jgi:hypothetical protein
MQLAPIAMVHKLVAGGAFSLHENVFSRSWPFKKVLVIDRNLYDEQNTHEDLNGIIKF